MACGIYIYLEIWDHGIFGRLDGISLSLPPSSSLRVVIEERNFAPNAKQIGTPGGRYAQKQSSRFPYSSSRYSQVHVVGETKLMKDVQNRSK